MMKNFVVLLSLALFLAVTTTAKTDTRTNGNVAYSLTKEYLESHQGVFQKIFIKETEDMTLRDVRV